MIDEKKMHQAVEFYIENGFRPMPLFGVEEGCKHPRKLDENGQLIDCRGQCLGKVPKAEHWPDREKFTLKDFPAGCNLALIMGQQLDGRWFVGFDIDGYLDLDQFLMLPQTLECTTNRGRHLIFEVPKDTPLGNWNDILSTRSETMGYKNGYKGALDIKFCRGAMASPPSETKTGGEYRWLEWQQPAMLPESEIKYLIRKRKFSHPNVSRYSKWSKDPSHHNKKP